MSALRALLRRSTLPVLVVLCLAALTASFAYAEGTLRPLATVIIGDPDAAVTGKLAVGTAVPGSKSLTVAGVIDFVGSGTVHNFFTQGPGNNMQIRSNVDEANAVYDATKSQWNMVMGSSNDMFMIKHSPAGATYNEDALFWINGSTGRVGIATFDTSNGAVLPFVPEARLHVETDAGWTILGNTTATSGLTIGVYGRSASSSGTGVLGYATGTMGSNFGVYGESISTAGTGAYGAATATSGTNYGVYGRSYSTSGIGVQGYASATTGFVRGVSGQSDSPSGTGVEGLATASTGSAFGVYGRTDSTSGRAVNGYASASSGENYGVHGSSNSSSGYGVQGVTWATTGSTFGVWGGNYSPAGAAVMGWANATTGTAVGVKGISNSPSGYGVYFVGGLAGTGTKSAIVETEAYGWRHLYAMESPQNWFEDFGQATLVAGEAVVSIEPIFAQTVNLEIPYHVFVTPRGDCGLYVDDQTATSFTVRALNGATCDVAFDYRIIAPRLDYEDLRLKPAENPEAVAAGVAEVK